MIDRAFENVAVHGPAAGVFAWNLLGHLKAQGIAAVLVMATDNFGPAEFAPIVEQSSRLAVITSIGDDFPVHMFALDRGLARVSICAFDGMNARIGDHPDEATAGAEINLEASDLSAVFARRPA